MTISCRVWGFHPRLPSVVHKISRRTISSSRSNGPIVLEKPDKFRPPSHAQKIRTAPTKHYGPQLSGSERASQRTKRYPNMMPPEGTFLHWFLTDKTIHIWISLGVLTSLAGYTLYANFIHNSPFAHLLPSGSDFRSHPIDSMRQWHDVWKMDVQHSSEIAAAKRKQKLDDVAKRAHYRKAHGLDQEGGLGGWTAKEESNFSIVDRAVGPAVVTGAETRQTPEGRTGREEHMDFEGRRKPVKKWLGIW